MNKAVSKMAYITLLKQCLDQGEKEHHIFSFLTGPKNTMVGKNYQGNK